jgi:hypothetical protein
MIMVEVTKIWWDGERLMAEPIDSAIMYKDNEVAQPDSTCNKTLRAEGKAYPRTCRKCGLGPCIADRVPPEQDPSCKDCQTESPCRAKGQDLDVCSLYVPPPTAQQEPDAYGYAKRLAIAIWEQHYKDVAPQWKPFDDLMGILTQIDNMTAGLTSHRQPLTDEQRRNIVRANKMRHDSDEIDPYGVIDDVEAAHDIKENT